MAVHVSVETVESKLLAAVRRRVAIGAVGTAWKPAADLVWAFLRSRPDLGTRGRNVFLYHHTGDRADPMDVDFGVEVPAPFEPAGEVRVVRTPAGRVASAVHVGEYAGLRQAHDAVHDWAKANGHSFTGWSWEVYGHWTDDPAKLETTVQYQLR